MGELEQEPRWFYVGNGQLRRKDSDGWTDEYRALDGPKRAAVSDTGEAAELPEVPEPVAGDPGPGWGARTLSGLGRLLRSSAHRLSVAGKLLMVGLWHLSVRLGHLIARGYRLAKERAQAPPRRGRHRGDARHDPLTAPREADHPSEATSPSLPG